MDIWMGRDKEMGREGWIGTGRRRWTNGEVGTRRCEGGMEGRMDREGEGRWGQRDGWMNRYVGREKETGDGQMDGQGQGDGREGWIRPGRGNGRTDG